MTTAVDIAAYLWNDDRDAVLDALAKGTSPIADGPIDDIVDDLLDGDADGWDEDDILDVLIDLAERSVSIEFERAAYRGGDPVAEIIYSVSLAGRPVGEISCWRSVEVESTPTFGALREVWDGTSLDVRLSNVAQVLVERDAQNRDLQVDDDF